MDEVLLNEGAIEALDEPTGDADVTEGLLGDEDIWGFTLDADEASEESEESDSGDEETNQSNEEAVTEAEAEAETPVSDEDKPDFLDVTYNHEGKKLTKREAREYAQKGMNYDKVRTQLDDANADIARYRQYEQFLEDIKGDFKTVDELMIDTRARMLMDAEKEKGNTITYENAKATVRERAPKPIDPKKLQADNAVRDFKKLYGNMKAADISKEVWDDVRVTGDLLGAYHDYEVRGFKKQISDLEAKVSDLEKELRDEKQKNKNSSRTVGSSKSSGNKNSTKGLVDKIWDSLG